LQFFDSIRFFKTITLS